MSMYMDYVNRDSMKNQNLQVLTTADWDFKIDYGTTGNKVMYQPPEDVVHVRTKGIQGVQQLPPVSVMAIELRGFTLLQPGKVNTKPEPVSLDLQDFEDQAMVTWIWDWQNKMSNLRNLASYRREDLFCDITIWQLNSSRNPVWRYVYYNCLPDGSNFQVTLDSDKNPLGAGTVTFNSEYMIPTPLNT